MKHGQIIKARGLKKQDEHKFVTSMLMLSLLNAIVGSAICNAGGTFIDKLIHPQTLAKYLNWNKIAVNKIPTKKRSNNPCQKISIENSYISRKNINTTTGTDLNLPVHQVYLRYAPPCGVSTDYEK